MLDTHIARTLTLLPLLALFCGCAENAAPAHQPSGDLVTSLTYPVDVWRDDRGIPHIRADGQGDLLFAQGYEMARDRLWHMDWSRRFVYGERSEAYGAGPNGKWHDDDVVKRAIGFKRLGSQQAAYFEKTHPATFQRIQSFCNGVNAYITHAKAGANGAVRPADLDRIDPAYWPAPWQPADVFAMAKALVFSQNFQGDVELILFGSDLLLGSAKFADLFRFAPLMPTYILEPAAQAAAWPHLTGKLLAPGGDDGSGLAAGERKDHALLYTAAQRQALGGAVGQMAGLLAEAMGKAGPGVMGGSNSWVLADDRTGGTGAILCNDPHMALEFPSRLFAMHLIDSSSGGTSTFGHQAVGMPWLTFGANEYLAWGITNSFTDTTDLYDEVLCEDGKSVKFQDKCVPWVTYDEVVKVRPAGGKLADAVPETHTVRWIPHHGPVLNDILPPSVGSVLEGLGKVFSARWTGFSVETREAVALSGIMEARTVGEGLKALDAFDGGVLNWSLADSAGSIAYRAAGRFPKRARPPQEAPPWMPLDGRGGDEWTGWLEGNDVPQVIDPPKGYIVTANNQQGPQDNDNNPANDSVYWGHFYDLGTRAWRISERIEALPAAVTLGDAAVLAGDNHSVLADALLPLLLSQEKRVCAQGPTPSCEAFQLLHGWDGDQAVHSAAGAIWSVWLAHLVTNTIGDDMPGLLLPLLSSFLVNLGARNMVHWSQPGFAGKAWWDDAKTPEVETADDMAVRALAEAVTQLTAFEGGKAMSEWQLGDVHKTRLAHVVYEDWNLPGQPHSGGCRTVNAGDYAPIDGKGAHNALPYNQSEGAVFRFCVAWKDGEPVGLQSLAGGQQAQHDAPHASDQLAAWLKTEYTPVVWTQSAVDKIANHVVLPAGLGQ